MPLMSTRMVYDHEEEIPQFVNARCQVCGKLVETKRAQKSHLRTAHLNQEIWSNVVRTRPFACPFCPYRAPQKITVETHICAIHLRTKPKVCKTCGDAFADPAGLSRHKKKHGRTAVKSTNDEDDDWEQPQAPQKVQRDSVRGGSRATRSTKRYTPYTKQAVNKAKATKKATPSENFAAESPRPLSPTYEAQPIQQKDVYYEVHPSQRQQNRYYNAPATPYNPPATSYSPPATSEIYPPVPPPTYDAFAPSYTQQAPVYPPAAYYNTNYAPDAPNTIYASTLSFNQVSSSSQASSSGSCLASASESSSLYIAEDPTIPQLRASDIQFAGFSFSAGRNDQPIAYNVLPAAQADAFSAAAELEVNASWYYAEDSSLYNAQESSPYNNQELSPYNISSPPENLTFDAVASSPEDYGFPATPTTPAALEQAQQQALNPAQQQALDLAQQQSSLDVAQTKSSPEPMIDFSRGSMLDVSFTSSNDPFLDTYNGPFVESYNGPFVESSNDPLFDLPNDPYIDFSQFDLDFSKIGGLDLTFGGSVPQPDTHVTKEELRIFDELFVAGAMS
uniref:C2H2-type domain-containing protein n=1 Tax=Schizophyllum commune (strain H4-8 / FGSC 9210) TaxID=578458 RepID=D8PZS0_SCHCM